MSFLLLEILASLLLAAAAGFLLGWCLCTLRQRSTRPPDPPQDPHDPR